MSRSLGVGLFRRPLWRRETDDSRSRMLATITFGYIAARRMVRPCVFSPCLRALCLLPSLWLRLCIADQPLAAVMLYT